MKLLRAVLLGLIAAFWVSGAMAQSANAPADPDYRVVSPAVTTDSPGKIEVLEFFSYGCGHCAQFHPMVKQWADRLPAGVVFKRVPVAWNAQFGSLARLYYALEATGDLARLDDEVFTAIHKDGERLDIPRALNEWLVKKGVNIQKFDDAYKSFGVQGRLRRADQLAREYAIDGVPTLAINGRFVVQAKTFEQTLKTADMLIARQKSGKAKK